jgi:coiled-coil domain-containing protein 12
MTSNHASLDAASVDRKARLVKLASLKRKRTESEPQHPGTTTTTTTAIDENIDDAAARQSQPRTDIYLSGRNFNLETKGPKLGFESDPAGGQDTLEARAAAVDQRTAEEARKDEEAAEKAIDLFRLQPKKPNWDLKRDLAEKMAVLDVRTQNAIARLVRERIGKAKKEAQARAVGTAAIDRGDVEGGDGGGEEVGMEGNTLVEGVHLREREEQEEERREREMDVENGIE